MFVISFTIIGYSGEPTTNIYTQHFNGSARFGASSHNSLSSSDNVHISDSGAERPLPLSSNHVASPVERVALGLDRSPTYTIQNNGWSDSEESVAETHHKRPTPAHHTKDKPPPLLYHHGPRVHVASKSGIASRPQRSRNKNGLSKMPSLGVQDMHDLVDELSLASSPGASLASIPDNESHTAPSPVNTHRLALDSGLEPSKSGSSLSPGPSHVSSSPSPSSLDEGSYSPTPELDLSPLTERTTPSPFDNPPEPSIVTSNVTVIPTQELEDELSFDVPDPPPEFMTNEEHPSVDDCAFIGRRKGISGTDAENSNSSFMEAVLYMLSVPTDMISSLGGLESPYTSIKMFLLQHIVQPLQELVHYHTHKYLNIGWALRNIVLLLWILG